METIQLLAAYPVILGVAAAAVAAGVGIYIGRRSFVANNGNQSLPPGPSPVPLIGNLLDMPKHHVYETFSKWAQTYGSIVHFKVPGMRFVVINSYDVAQELLSKRPSTTGDRNNGYLFKDLMDLGWGLACLDLGPTHSDVRKMLRQGIGLQRVPNHDLAIEQHAVSLMLRLPTFKGNPAPIIVSGIGRLVTTLTYGEEIWKRMGDDLTAWNVEGIRYVNEALFSFWMVDVFNFLRFVPSWAPGAYFKRMASRAKWLSDQIRYIPFAEVEELHKSGDLGQSIATDLIEAFGATENTRDALATLYGAGTDTTSSATNTFYYTLYLFPEVARKVYAEIDAVTEGTRMPQVKDRINMPYTEAAWKEAFRWNPFFPIGVPHVNQKDEVINGFLLPKGSSIMPNNYFMLMDPQVWGDPDVFRPERFLEPGSDTLPDPMAVTFGYGMRLCPGMYLADRIGFQFTVAMVSLFSIVPLEGRSLPTASTVEYLDSGFRLPLGFECRFLPRNEKAKHLLSTLALES